MLTNEWPVNLFDNPLHPHPPCLTQFKLRLWTEIKLGIELKNLSLLCGLCFFFFFSLIV